MIDVTFLLIIFFMVVTALSDASKSKIDLPEAIMAEPDRPRIPGRVAINVLKNGVVEVMRREYSDSALKRLLAMEYQLTHGDRAILVRADKNVPFVHVRRVLQLCADNNLWRIAFSTLAE